jgi:transcriptional regulator with XRE-family HTH domain
VDSDKHKEQASAELERLRLLAKKKGLTDQDIADRTGFNRPNVSRMLHGHCIPRYDNYLKLVDAIKRTW